jgi:hypothetical protein
MRTFPTLYIQEIYNINTNAHEDCRSLLLSIIIKRIVFKVHIPLLRSFIQKIRPGPRLIDPFRNKFVFHSEGLLTPRPTPKLEDHPLSFGRGCLFNIFAANMDLLEIGVNVVDWIGLAQDRYRWRALVNSVMNFRVP